MNSMTSMIGVDPASIVPLSPTSNVADAPARFAAVAADWIAKRYRASGFVWEEHWHYAPYELLALAFSSEELIRLWHGCIFASKLDEHFEEHEALVWKTRHALWRYGCSRDYQRFIVCHNGLGRLAIDLPDFNVRVTHTGFSNTAGWVEGCRNRPIYLDAAFGALVYYRESHVLTIGFAPSEHGILIAQVQLREKRGNRFLYKLPMSCLDFALSILRRAFPDDSLYLVTGSSTTRGIRAAYAKSGGLPAEAAQRITRFYDQPLHDYLRMEETVEGSSDDGRVFVALAPRKARTQAA